MIAIAQISVMIDLDQVGMPTDTQTENDFYFAKSFVRATLIDELNERLFADDGSIDELIGYKIVASLDELPDTNNPN